MFKHQFLPQLYHELLWIVIQKLLQYLYYLIGMRAAQQFFLYQRNKFLLHTSHVFVTHFLKPWSNVSLQNYRLWEFFPIYSKLPQLHLVLGHFLLQLLYSGSYLLLLLFVDLLVLDLGYIQFDQRFGLFFLFIELLVAFKEFIFFQFFGFLLNLWSRFRCLDQNFFNFLCSNFDLLLCYYLHSFCRLRLL
jgi:hypothetical protein